MVERTRQPVSVNSVELSGIWSPAMAVTIKFIDDWYVRWVESVLYE